MYLISFCPAQSFSSKPNTTTLKRLYTGLVRTFILIFLNLIYLGAEIISKDNYGRTFAHFSHEIFAMVYERRTYLTDDVSDATSDMIANATQMHLYRPSHT
jgi:hypothetical protein